MCRSIFQFLFGTILFFTLSLSALLTVVFVTAIDSNSYRQALRQTNSYEFITTELRSFASSSLTPTTTEGTAEAGTEMQIAVATALSEFIEAKINTALIENMVENNLDNVSKYYAHQTTELLIYFPIGFLYDSLPELVDSFLQKSLTEALTKYPECTAGETLVAGEEISCIPPGTTVADLRALLPVDISDPDALLAELSAEFPFLADRDRENIPLSELAAANTEEEDGLMAVATSIARSREILDLVKLGFVIVWLCNVALLLVYMILSRPGFIRKVKAFSILLVPVGIVLTALSALGLVIDKKLMISQYVMISGAELFGSFDQLQLVAFSLVDLVLTRVLLVGVVVLLGSIVLYVLGAILTRRREVSLLDN